MKHPLLQPIINFFIPPPQDEVDLIVGQSHRLSQLIEQAFTMTLRFSLLVFCLALIVASSTLQAEGATEVLRFFMAGAGFIAILAIVRRINLIYRVRGFLAILYLIALVELVNYGYSVEAFIFFLTLTALGILLQGLRGGLFIAALNITTLTIFGWQIAHGNYQPLIIPPGAVTSPASIEAGLAILVVFAGGVTVLLTTIALLLRSVNTAWQEETEAKTLVQQERDRLDQRVMERTQQLEENEVALQAYADQLAAARDQAVASNHYKSLLLRKVGHELRTPLTGILGYAEMLNEGIAGQLSDKQQYFAEQIIASSVHLAGLINDLLDLAKIEQGALKIVEQPFALADMLNYLENLLKPSAAAKSLAFSLYCSPDMPDRIVGDEKRLRQIVVNLTNNAIKFTTQGSVHIGIEPAAEHGWHILVEDTGAGISPEMQNKIFDSFWQADSSASSPHNGYGLGLSVVQQLVTFMGGHIEVMSEVGRGSTFTVWLPLSTPSTQADLSDLSTVERQSQRDNK